MRGRPLPCTVGLNEAFPVQHIPLTANALSICCWWRLSIRELIRIVIYSHRPLTLSRGIYLTDDKPLGISSTNGA